MILLSWIILLIKLEYMRKMRSDQSLIETYLKIINYRKYFEIMNLDETICSQYVHNWSDECLTSNLKRFIWIRLNPMNWNSQLKDWRIWWLMIKRISTEIFLRGAGKHLTNGSPVYPILQMHIGLWLITLHCVLIPHEFTQGDLHLLSMHASSLEHSLFTTHSGRQFGGVPMKFAKQVHTACSFTVRHWLFDPHGDGLQGSDSFMVAVRGKVRLNSLNMRKIVSMVCNTRLRMYVFV